MRTHLDLCSGIGGFALAAAWAGYTTIGFCEIDPYCQRVLRHHWPEVPVHDDLRTLSAATVRDWSAGPIDLLTAGYPCQPFSYAGQRGGETDDRHLWPAIADLVAALRPRWCLFENVAGHISLGLDAVLADLETTGYAATALVVPACGLDAPHRRDRVWIIAAHADLDGQSVGAVDDRARSGQLRAWPAADTDDTQWRAAVAEGCGDGGQLGLHLQRPEGASASASRRRGPVADAASLRVSGLRKLDDGNSFGMGTQILPDRSGLTNGAAGQNEAFGGMGEPDDGLSGRLARSTGLVPWWTPCPCCDEMWCDRCDAHTFECACPHVEEMLHLMDARWGGNPVAAFDDHWESGIARVSTGERDNGPKLKALGNAIVPQLAYVLISAITEAAA